METIVVSASPHIHSDRTSRKLMYDVVIALVPAFLVSLYLFGISAFHRNRSGHHLLPVLRICYTEVHFKNSYHDK